MDEKEKLTAGEFETIVQEFQTEVDYDENTETLLAVTKEIARVVYEIDSLHLAIIPEEPRFEHVLNRVARPGDVLNYRFNLLRDKILILLKNRGYSVFIDKSD